MGYLYMQDKIYYDKHMEIDVKEKFIGIFDEPKFNSYLRMDILRMIQRYTLCSDEKVKETIQIASNVNVATIKQMKLHFIYDKNNQSDLSQVRLYTDYGDKLVCIWNITNIPNDNNSLGFGVHGGIFNQITERLNTISISNGYEEFWPCYTHYALDLIVNIAAKVVNNHYTVDEAFSLIGRDWLDLYTMKAFIAKNNGKKFDFTDIVSGKYYIGERCKITNDKVDQIQLIRGSNNSTNEDNSKWVKLSNELKYDPSDFIDTAHIQWIKLSKEQD